MVALRASAVLLVACMWACGGDSSESDDDGHGTGARGASSGGTGGTGGAAGAGAGSGAGAGMGGVGAGSGSGGAANLYTEPSEIVGGACTDSPVASSPPCSGAAEHSYCRLDDPTDVIMATCSGFGLDQCELMDDCEPGWHACTATEYVARGGRDVLPSTSGATDRAWLAACAQDLGDSRFRNEPCSYCGDASFEPVVQWWCDGEVVFEGGMAGTTLGVVAAPECMRVGENTAGHGAYWTMAFTTGAPSFVMCCLDAL